MSERNIRYTGERSDLFVARILLGWRTLGHLYSLRRSSHKVKGVNSVREGDILKETGGGIGPEINYYGERKDVPVFSDFGGEREGG